MSYFLRSPDGDVIEVPTASLRVRLKAQGYRDVEPEVKTEDPTSGLAEDWADDSLADDGEADED